MPKLVYPDSKPELAQPAQSKQRKIRDIFADPNRWCKRRFAQDAQGNPVLIQDPNAVCWCLAGALDLCYPVDNRPSFMNVVGRIYDKIGTVSISLWNDKHGYDKVKALVDELDI